MAAFDLSDDGVLLDLLTGGDPEQDRALYREARAVCDAHYGRRIFFRGLIEFTNHCKNDCYYCGIRRSNARASRYRLSLSEILGCCRRGDALGFHSFVLQGGEDPYFDDERLTGVVSAIRREFPDHAITLSVGERSGASYQALFDAGADRFLLRHETADSAHYARLHPPELTLESRVECLHALKNIGFQVGAGCMVGSPHQRPEHLVKDLRFLEELQPQMVGIGPFLPQADTPFGDRPGGSVELTLRMVALCRLLLPTALLPATTALGTADSRGRERALDAGANVVMPNLSPIGVREKYALYDNKAHTGAEAAELLRLLQDRIRAAGYQPDLTRGDHLAFS